MIETDEKDVKSTEGAEEAPDVVQETSPEVVDGEKEEEKRGPTGWIPKVRLDEVISEREAARQREATEREERIRLEERLKAIEDAKQSTAVKPFTRVQLKTMVENGQITQDDADEHWAKQIRDQAVADARHVVATHTAEALKLNTVLAKINEFTSVLPAIMQRGTPEWTKCSQEYSEICEIEGQPRTELQKQSMMLRATKAVFGNVERLRRDLDARSPKHVDKETVMDTTSTQKRPSAASAKNDPITTLSPQQKAHYEKMFQKTDDYPNGWEDVRKELLWKKPNLTRRGR